MLNIISEAICVNKSADNNIPIEDFKKSYFGFRKLPFILQKIQEFDQKLKNISKD